MCSGGPSQFYPETQGVWHNTQHVVIYTRNYTYRITDVLSPLRRITHHDVLTRLEETRRVLLREITRCSKEVARAFAPSR